MSEKYGCHNRLPFRKYHLPTGAENFKKNRIPHVMTTECQFTKTELGKTDPKCNNCERKEK
jgi:hypothetical protein